MRIRSLTTTLCVAVVVTVGFTVSSTKNRLVETKTVAQIRSSQETQIRSLPASPSSPDDISDRVAYSLFLRFLSNPPRSQDVNVRRQTRAYLRQARLGKIPCATCTAEITDEADIDALIDVATEFQQRTGVLDQQAAQLKRLNRINPNPVIKVQLAQLQKQREAVIDEIINSLPKRLSNHSIGGLRRFIREHLKLNIKQGGA